MIFLISRFGALARSEHGIVLVISYERAEMITYTILGAPSYKYSVMGPKTLF